jgi:hypothetical protein
MPFNLLDKRDHQYCGPCKEIIDSRPAEVLFGIQINLNGDIYFSMNNKKWFDKIFKNNSYGVSVDLISKDRYSCSRPDNEKDYLLPHGTMILPVYKNDLLKGYNDLADGEIFTLIGHVPKTLMNKDIEGNLVVVNGNYICHYTNFVNIDRTDLSLLPMGLFTDSLLHISEATQGENREVFSYSAKINFEVPFAKSSVTFDANVLNRLYDSLKLKNYKIRKIELRVYSSIEGSEKGNDELMKRRADGMINALKVYDPSLKRIKITTAENWLEFFKDIQGTKFSDLSTLSKSVIKQKLTDKIKTEGIENILANHRKVIADIYLEPKTAVSAFSDSGLASGFKDAINSGNILKAKGIQKELLERIMDNKLPADYIKRLEVPQTKEFSSLINDREVYKYLLKATSEYEALQNFKKLQKMDPENGRINYNICALQFFLWQYGSDTMVSKTLLKQINNLDKQGIDKNLTKRMMINYHIMKCADYMRTGDYAAKDNSLSRIKDIYAELILTDEEILSLAKYYTNYSHQDWAEDILIPKIGKLDADEDLIFYYFNLLCFTPGEYESDDFHKAALNAINLNRKRFCNFFLPINRGGASMQLLEYEEMKTLYCETCR